jgi:CheY-like chemotaxis protein
MLHRPLLRVLCVDDNRDFADSLGVLLGLSGFAARPYYDGRSALAALDEYRPDACLVDLTMPGMDGFEVARGVRAWAGGRKVPLVAVTGLGDDDTRRRAVEAGFDLHLVKPVNPDRLTLLLADLVVLMGGVELAGGSGDPPAAVPAG